MRRKIGAIAAAVVVAGGALGVVSLAEPPPDIAKSCEDWNLSLSDGECFAAGTIRFVLFHNLQGAAQFCKWKAANPGEWSRLKGFAQTKTPPTNIITWFGGAQLNALEAYFATGAPTFTIQPNTSTNVCKTPLTPPTVAGVTPGETTVTVTIEEG
jgi:hypothetical protein